MTTQQNYAPGEWVVSNHGDSLIVVANGQWITGQVGACGGDRHANANLIAAAPAMLKTLKALLAEAREADEQSNDWFHSEEAMEKAEAAIKKAEGT